MLCKYQHLYLFIFLLNSYLAQKYRVYTKNGLSLFGFVKFMTSTYKIAKKKLRRCLEFIIPYSLTKPRARKDS